jgi:hypothetical protein
MATVKVYSPSPISEEERLTVDVVNLKYRPLTRNAQVVRNAVANCIKPSNEKEQANTFTSLVNTVSKKIYSDLFESVYS